MHVAYTCRGSMLARCLGFIKALPKSCMPTHACSQCVRMLIYTSYAYIYLLYMHMRDCLHMQGTIYKLFLQKWSMFGWCDPQPRSSSSYHRPLTPHPYHHTLITTPLPPYYHTLITTPLSPLSLTTALSHHTHTALLPHPYHHRPYHHTLITTP